MVATGAHANLAGPNAAEVLLEIAFPAHNFEAAKWTTYSGIVMARKGDLTRISSPRCPAHLH